MFVEKKCMRSFNMALKCCSFIKILSLKNFIVNVIQITFQGKEHHFAEILC